MSYSTVVNSIGMHFRRLPPGVFRMGSPPDEPQRGADETPHPVRLTRPFALGVFLVTQEQYRQVTRANPSQFRGEAGLPVDSVTWDEARAFCAALGALPEEKRLGHTYRLPTEAEWEYACRAGTRTPFWFGARIGTDRANYDGTTVYGPDGTPGPYLEATTPVDRFPANPWGLHDMHGNLLQWCEDRYGPYAEGEQTDPRGPPGGEGGVRVLRGGAWCSDAAQCRAARRRGNAAADRFGFVGFRVVLCVPSGGAV